MIHPDAKIMAIIEELSPQACLILLDGVPALDKRDDVSCLPELRAEVRQAYLDGDLDGIAIFFEWEADEPTGAK